MKEIKPVEFTTEIERIEYTILKDVLIGLHNLNAGYATWNWVYINFCNLYQEDEQRFINSSIKSSDSLRTKYWHILQQDEHFRQESGLTPISKNRVGVKLTDDIEEINEFVKSEYGRAMSLLKKVQHFKNVIKNEKINKHLEWIEEIESNSKKKGKLTLEEIYSVWAEKGPDKDWHCVSKNEEESENSLLRDKEGFIRKMKGLDNE